MRSRGFTLIELLVVIVVLGLLVGIAVPRLGGGDQQAELRNEANKLHALLRIAADEAVFNNQEIGVIIDNDVYEFLVYDEEKSSWTNSNVPVLRTRQFPEWLTVEFEREGKKRQIPTRENQETSEFRASTDETASRKTPQFMLLSSGEVTGFRISLQLEDNDESRIEIISTDSGEIKFDEDEQDS